MTEMRRVTISIPDDLDDAIIALKKRDEFVRCSYSDIIRTLLKLGLEADTNTKKEA